MTGTPPPPPPGRQRPPRIVAELGRPETPAETAARKAESSRNHRLNQTALNLVLAIVASVGIVLLLVLGVVRTNGNQLQTVDYLKVAADAQRQVTTTLVAPKLPSGWTSNSAQIRPAGADGVQSWYVGLVTPDKQGFISITQGLDANPTWVSNQVEQNTKTSERDVGGLEWSIYDLRGQTHSGNLAYAMVTVHGPSTVVLAGTATPTQFDLLAERAAQQIQG